VFWSWLAPQKLEFVCLFFCYPVEVAGSSCGIRGKEPTINLLVDATMASQCHSPSMVFAGDCYFVDFSWMTAFATKNI